MLLHDIEETLNMRLRIVHTIPTSAMAAFGILGHGTMLPVREQVGYTLLVGSDWTDDITEECCATILADCFSDFVGW